MTSRNTQILGSRSDDGYSAKLYESRLDDCGNLYLELIFHSQFVNGVHSETYVKDRFVRTQEKIKLKEKLVDLIWVDLEKNKHWLCGETRLQTCIASDFFEYYNFFHHYKHFRSIEFYFLFNVFTRKAGILRYRIERCVLFEDVVNYISYGHREKSIRLALYKYYEISLWRAKRYDPKADMIICRSFDDPNLIRRLINAPVKYELFNGISMTYAIHFLRWLQKRYSPSSIVKSIESRNLSTGNSFTPIWVNIMLMVNHLSINGSYVFDKYFQKIKMNAKSLHDELMRIHRITRIKETENYSYAYKQAEYQIEINICHLEFKLVKSTMELHDWSEMLHNCLFGFNERIIRKWCLIIGVFIDDTLRYAVEFNGSKILQAYGKYNELIADDDMEYIEEWVEKASKHLENCIYGDSCILNPQGLTETDEEYIDDLYLEEFEEECSYATHAYNFELTHLIEPTIALLKKHFFADIKVYDIYIEEEKIIVETEYSQDYIYAQIQGIKIETSTSLIESSYMLRDFIHIVKVVRIAIVNHP